MTNLLAALAAATALTDLALQIQTMASEAVGEQRDLTDDEMQTIALNRRVVNDSFQDELERRRAADHPPPS